MQWGTAGSRCTVPLYFSLLCPAHIYQILRGYKIAGFHAEWTLFSFLRFSIAMQLLINRAIIALE